MSLKSKVMKLDELEVGVVPSYEFGFSRAIPLRDQLRQARSAGVSLDVVPTPQSFDEEEWGYDPESDIRTSKFDRAEYAQAQAAAKKVDPVIAAGQDPVAATAAPTPAESPAAPGVASPAATEA